MKPPLLITESFLEGKGRGPLSLKGGDERNSIGAAVDGKFMGDGVVGGCATGVIDAVGVGVGENGAIGGFLVLVEVGVAGEVGEMSRVDEAGTEGKSGKVGEVVPVDVAVERCICDCGRGASTRDSDAWERGNGHLDPFWRCHGGGSCGASLIM